MLFYTHLLLLQQPSVLWPSLITFNNDAKPPPKWILREYDVSQIWRGVVSYVSGSDNRIFARVLQTSHINGWFSFVKRTLSWYLLFLLILRHWEARRVPRRHSISSKTWCHGLSLISNNPHTRCEHLCISFSASAPSGANLFSITGKKVMTSGIAFDRPDRLSRLRAFPYDRFKIYVTKLYKSLVGPLTVSYTHLTLPTKRIV